MRKLIVTIVALAVCALPAVTSSATAAAAPASLPCNPMISVCTFPPPTTPPTEKKVGAILRCLAHHHHARRWEVCLKR